MKPPVVVICGRPNVGKSSLFNALLRRRVAIVDPTAGVTRDRVTATLERGGKSLLLVDTGGIGLFDDVELRVEVERQIDVALREADVVVLVVDALDGPLPADEEIARRLRALDRPLLLVANKCDGTSIEREVPAFHRLGLGEPIPVSAQERYGVEELVETLFEAVLRRCGGAADDGAGGPPPIRLAVVGKVNAGKSTLVNLLVGGERVIVSDQPGTTRDAVDAPFERAGRRFVAVDTAGLRKRRVVEGTVDFYGQARTAEAIRRADVVLLLVDASRDVSQIDKSLAGQVARSHKPVVVGVSKWDVAEAAGRTPGEFEPYLRQQLPRLEFAPICFLSAAADFNVDATLKVVADLYEQAGFRAPTGELNRVIERAETRRFPRTSRGKFPKVLYATQTGVHPPTVVVFVNDARLFGDEYRRYLANRLREVFPFREVPIRVWFRSREKK